MRALVIDDSVSMRMYVADLIEGLGWETATVCDGRDALRNLEEAGADDYLMKSVTAEMLQGKMRLIGLLP